MTADSLNQYTYDGAGRLCAVFSQGADTEYLYNADGRRVATGHANNLSCNPTTDGFVPTSFYIIGPMGKQLSEMDGSGNWLHTNVFADGKLLATYYGPNTYFALTDWLGTKRVETDSSGTVQSISYSLPFGDNLVVTGSGPDAAEQHFTGKVRDSESGNDYFLARYYNSATGRFLSPDPADLRAIKIANPQTWNLYVYTLNNPLRYTDPTGMYLCADSSKCNSAADKAFEAARQNDLNSKNKAVAAAAAAYGDPTKNNHVTVQFTDVKNGETSAQYSTNGKTISYSITVSIPNAASGTALNGLVGHEGTHTEQYAALFGSFKPSAGFNGALDLTHYAAENGAYHNQASVWQLSGHTWTMNGHGKFLITPSSTPGQISNTINQFLADPANGYGGLAPQNPGGPMINLPQ